MRRTGGIEVGDNTSRGKKKGKIEIKILAAGGEQSWKAG